MLNFSVFKTSHEYFIDKILKKPVKILSTKKSFKTCFVGNFSRENSVNLGKLQNFSNSLQVVSVRPEIFTNMSFRF